mgnify:CR=1 FL=1
MTEDNLREHIMHKDLWKTLRLTSGAGASDEPPGDADDHRGGVQQAGASQGNSGATGWACHGVRQPGADGGAMEVMAKAHRMNDELM